jgi:hypothetical protein
MDRRSELRDQTIAITCEMRPWPSIKVQAGNRTFTYVMNPLATLDHLFNRIMRVRAWLHSA